MTTRTAPVPAGQGVQLTDGSVLFGEPHAGDFPSVDCDECGDTGWISIPCSRDENCPGGDCCDRRCRCEAGRNA